MVRECPECGGRIKFDKNRGENVCMCCGTVIESEAIDFGQEWREFNWDQAMSRRRSGTPISYTKPDKGMTTQIGKSTDIYNLRGNQRREYWRMKKWEGRINMPIERNIRFALVELKRISGQLNLPPIVIEEAAKVYRMVSEKGLVRGRSMESVVAGAIYIACKRFQIARTLKEIADEFPLDVKDVGKTYRFICRQLGVKILPPNPLDYIDRFASELALPASVRTKAIKIIGEAQNREITSGKGPTGIAAASLYIASLLEDEKRTQREVADVAGVTEVTIRNRYKELIKKLGLEEEVEKIRLQIENQ